MTPDDKTPQTEWREAIEMLEHADKLLFEAFLVPLDQYQANQQLVKLEQGKMLLKKGTATLKQHASLLASQRAEFVEDFKESESRWKYYSKNVKENDYSIELKENALVYNKCLITKWSKEGK